VGSTVRAVVTRLAVVSVTVVGMVRPVVTVSVVSPVVLESPLVADVSDGRDRIVCEIGDVSARGHGRAEAEHGEGGQDRHGDFE